jgi:hypothetical protein
MRLRKAVHPLLLEPTYWRNRLRALDLRCSQLMITPRPDLSGNGKDVVEFRLRAHDGARLWGLLARPEWFEGDRPARIRSVGPADRPEVDPRASQEGVAELVFQEPAGRRLEDRVLDVVRICHLASTTKGIAPDQVSFSCSGDDRVPDEFVIAEQLFVGKFC